MNFTKKKKKFDCLFEQTRDINNDNHTVEKRRILPITQRYFITGSYILGAEKNDATRTSSSAQHILSVPDLGVGIGKLSFPRAEFILTDFIHRIDAYTSSLARDKPAGKLKGPAANARVSHEGRRQNFYLLIARYIMRCPRD